MIFVSFRRRFARPVNNVPTAPSQTQPPTSTIFSGWDADASVAVSPSAELMVFGVAPGAAFNLTQIDLTTFSQAEKIPLGISWVDDGETYVNGEATFNGSFTSSDNVLVVPNHSIAPAYSLSVV